MFLDRYLVPEIVLSNNWQENDGLRTDPQALKTAEQ